MFGGVSNIDQQPQSTFHYEEEEPTGNGKDQEPISHPIQRRITVQIMWNNQG